MKVNFNSFLAEFLEFYSSKDEDRYCSSTESFPTFLISVVNEKTGLSGRLCKLYLRYMTRSNLNIETKIAEGSGYSNVLSEIFIEIKQDVTFIQAGPTKKVNLSKIAALKWKTVNCPYNVNDREHFDEYPGIIVCIDGAYKLETYVYILLFIDIINVTSISRINFYDGEKMIMFVMNSIKEDKTVDLKVHNHRDICLY